MVERFREDRLVRWGLYGSAPFVWLALALVNPFLLLLPPLIVLALWAAMRRDMVERFEPEEEPDLY
ncbi:MAG TPA: hypothetical protein VIE18_03335 [Gaiellaceae bacterium]|jgi:hypothetical protein